MDTRAMKATPTESLTQLALRAAQIPAVDVFPGALADATIAPPLSLLLESEVFHSTGRRVALVPITKQQALELLKTMEPCWGINALEDQNWYAGAEVGDFQSSQPVVVHLRRPPSETQSGATILIASSSGGSHMYWLCSDTAVCNLKRFALGSASTEQLCSWFIENRSAVSAHVRSTNDVKVDTPAWLKSPWISELLHDLRLQRRYMANAEEEELLVPRQVEDIFIASKLLIERAEDAVQEMSIQDPRRVRAVMAGLVPVISEYLLSERSDGPFKKFIFRGLSQAAGLLFKFNFVSPGASHFHEALKPLEDAGWLVQDAIRLQTVLAVYGFNEAGNARALLGKQGCPAARNLLVK